MTDVLARPDSPEQLGAHRRGELGNRPSRKLLLAGALGVAAHSSNEQRRRRLSGGASHATSFRTCWARTSLMRVW